MLSVHPVPHGRVAERALGLRDLVFVVREDVVDAAGMQVEALAEVFRAHGRTLDVPSREAGSPRRRPRERPARLGLLPEREVDRIALRRIHLAAHALLQRLADVSGELPVAGKALHREVDGAVDLVREPIRYELLDDRDHLGHVVGGAREVRSGKDPKAPLILMEGLLIELRDFLWRLALGERGRDDLVFTAIDA